MEAEHLFGELRHTLGLTGLTGVRVLRRYDVEGVDAAVYAAARTTVLSEPQVDALWDEVMPAPEGEHTLLAVEALPGQYDQRADSCAQCIQMMHGGERPTVRAATVYVLEGALHRPGGGQGPGLSHQPGGEPGGGAGQARHPPPGLPRPRRRARAGGLHRPGRRGSGERAGPVRSGHGSGRSAFLQAYFRDEEGRDPTLTEVRVVDTYWSDHCRHTTFSTHLDEVEIADDNVKAAYERYLSARVEVYGAEKAAKRPQTLMDIATLGAKTLKKRGLLPELDESEEINACSIHVPAQVDGKEQDWLLMFKNETHNHPTEIEPFGGAATCIGGCIRDPLSGRVYVHQAMRLTGCGDPRTPVEQTLEGKLPQRKIAQTAAAGYSSYGNQIGLATGHVAELYHEGYVAKHLECGAVVGAAPASNVRRERPAPGDVVILLGGRTGRDGIGGATGSSKSHNKASLDTMASEVQKGNAPEERKLQRLFRDPAVTRLIKRCNDFGAGGVSVAIGELADGLSIDLDAVRKKYDGLDGTELAISESQERMAVVVAPADVDALHGRRRQGEPGGLPGGLGHGGAPHGHDLAGPDRGQTCPGPSSTPTARPSTPGCPCPRRTPPRSRATCSTLREMAASLKCASRRGLTERFDGSIGAGSVLMPFGGRTQRTPAQVMAALLPRGAGAGDRPGQRHGLGLRPRGPVRRPLPGGKGRGLRLRGQAGGRRRGLPEGLSDPPGVL